MSDDPLYRHRGTRAIQRMVEFAPSTGGLALWVRHQDLPEGAPGVQDAQGATTLPVSTDGNTLYYGAGFDKLPMAQQVGLVAHEVLHIALRHPQRYLDLRRLLGDVDLQLFNICADAIVNSALAHLRWLKLPASAVYLDQILKSALSVDQGIGQGIGNDIDKALLEWDVERLYRAIDDRRPQSAGGDQKGRRPQAGAGSGQARKDGPRSSRARALGDKSDADLVPGPDTQGDAEAEAERSREWHERILRGHAGDGVHSMLRALLADLPRTRTPWEQVLRTLLSRSLLPIPHLSWSRPARSYIANQGRAGPHRRMPWEPGHSGMKPVPRLVLMVDVSGSIGDPLLERFAREVQAITRRLSAGLVLIVGDDRVRRVEVFAPGRSDLSQISFAGGGGTDFTPLLEEADRHRPDIAVVLTDLDGPARFRPAWPVIWAVPESHAMAVPPFGRKLTLTS